MSNASVQFINVQSIKQAINAPFSFINAYFNIINVHFNGISFLLMHT
jgi:hypothetical protein